MANSSDPPLDFGELCNYEAEQALLGAILYRNDLYDEVADVLDAEAFADPTLALIYQVAGQMIARDQQANAVTLKAYFEHDDNLAQVGGAGFLAELQGNYIGLMNLPDYAQVINDYALRRRAAEAALDLIEAVKDAEPDRSPRSILEEHSGLIDQIVGTGGHQGLRAARDEIPEITEQLIDAAERYRGGGVAGLSTGFGRVDRALCGGLRRRKLYVLGGGTSMGKAQPLHSKVLTPDGWRPLGSLSVGDDVVTSGGVRSHIVGVFPQGRKEIYTIEFWDGRSVECCDDHLWLVYKRRWPKNGKVISTRDLRRLLSFKSNKRRIKIPLAAPWQGIKTDLPVDPYILGALIGDGSLSNGGTPRITTADDHVVKEIGRRLPPDLEILKNATLYQYSIVNAEGKHKKGCQGVVANPLMTSLKSLNLAGCLSTTKRIPRQYMSCRLDDRLALIRGLMDTDGTVERSSGAPYISVSNQGLAEDIQYLIWSIGGIARITKRRPFYYLDGRKRFGRISYRVNVRYKHPKDLFSLPRKRKLAPANHRYRDDLRLTVRRIYPHGSTECACIKIDHPDQLYVTDNFVTTHNTALATAIIENVAAQGVPVAVFSMEMGHDELLLRMACARARVELSRAQMGSFSDLEYQAIKRELGALGQMPIHIDESMSNTTEAIRAETRRLQRRCPLGLVVVDYLQLCEAPHARKTGGNRTAEITEISRRLKMAAAQLNVPFLVLSQLSREHQNRDDRRPILKDLRESGSLEQDADVVIFVYRDAYYLERDGKKPKQTEESWRADLEAVRNKAEFIVRKQRSGPLGTVVLHFDAPYTYFAENPDQQEEIPL